MSDDASTEAARALWAKLQPTGKAGWLPSVVLPDGWVVTASGVHTGVVLTDDLGYTRRLIAEDRPDFEHPGTLGCLLWMVRKAWNDPGAYAHMHPRVFESSPVTWTVIIDPIDPSGDGESIMDYPETIDIDGPTEALALLRAIEAAL